MYALQTLFRVYLYDVHLYVSTLCLCLCLNDIVVNNKLQTSYKSEFLYELIVTILCGK